MTTPSLTLAVIAGVLAAPAPFIAHAAGPAGPAVEGAEVATRAIVQSIERKDAQRVYIRLKLIPRAKIPFSTLTYRVLDARLIAGLREGDSVSFQAERRDGENVLTAIRTAPPCQRFRECQ